MYSTGKLAADPQHPGNQGLLAWYAVAPGTDLGNATAPDISGYNVPATHAGNPTFRPTPWQNARTGTADQGSYTIPFGTGANFVSRPMPLASTDSFTMACYYACLGTLPSSPMRCVEVGTLGMTIYGSGGEFGFVREGIAWHQSGAKANADQTYRMVLVWDAPTSHIALYLDGGGHLGATASLLSFATGSVMTFGAATEGGSVGTGNVWGVQLWNRAMPASEVALDFRWSASLSTDPRAYRPSTRSVWVTTAGVATTTYVPAFASGFGW